MVGFSLFRILARRLIVLPRYLTLIQVFAATGVPIPLPIFDLSHVVFPNGAQEQTAEHAD